MAFVGATGAGKSSIVNLISRFYEFQKGRITIDGVDIRNIPVDELRSQIGVVLQDVFLFSGSLRENVTLHDDNITDDAIWEAIRMVGAERFVERLPNGLDHDVRERGATLSVGQRQLIAFVRAYLSNPHILILDEATSSIDSESEQWIQRATEILTDGRTSLLVAHRLNTVRDADRIVVLHRVCSRSRAPTTNSSRKATSTTICSRSNSWPLGMAERLLNQVQEVDRLYPVAVSHATRSPR